MFIISNLLILINNISKFHAILFFVLGSVLTVAIIMIKDKTTFGISKYTKEVVIERERLAELGKLTAGAAHSLKTPVMSISGSLEALDELVDEYNRSIGDNEVTEKDHMEIAKEMKDWISKAKPYCSYMSQTITAVKGQASKKNNAKSEIFTIEDMIERVEILLDYEIRKHYCNMNINIKLDKNTQIKGEINDLVQVMNNIISNAIEAYDGSSGNIDVIIDSKDDRVEIQIKDYGKGIPDKIRKKLLKNIVTTKGKKGTGIGIYLSYYTIKKKFRGTMWIESQEGKGTSVYIRIPVNNKLAF
ncbi:UNVERIFIED_CONTAM: Signal transduction histidine kinase [Acetivibrio alkalicellulosi]